jgi:hypothetical protein
VQVKNDYDSCYLLLKYLKGFWACSNMQVMQISWDVKYQPAVGKYLTTGPRSNAGKV